MAKSPSSNDFWKELDLVILQKRDDNRFHISKVLEESISDTMTEFFESGGEFEDILFSASKN